MLVDRVNTTAHGLARHDDRLRPVPQPQVRSVHAEGLLPAARLLRQHRYYDSRAFGDGTRYVEPQLELADARAGRARARRCRPRIERARAGTLKTTTPELRAAQAQWEASDPRGRRALDAAARRARATATGGVTLTPLPDGSVAGRPAPNPTATLHVVDARARRRRHHRRAARGAARPVAAERRPGARRATATSASRRARLSRAWRRRRRRGRCRDHERQGGRAAYAFEPADCSTTTPAYAAARAGRGRSTPCATRRRAAAARRARRRRAARLRGGTRAHAADRSPRRHHRPGPRPLPALGDRRRRSARRRPSAAGAAAAIAGDAAGRADRSAGRRAGGVLPVDHAALKPTRERCARARQGARRLQIPTTLVMHERPAFERPSYAPARARQLHAPGARVYAGTPAALPSAARRPACRTGSAWRAGSSTDEQPAHRARHGQPDLGAVLRPRPRRDQRGLRHAGRAADPSRAARLAGHRVRGARAGARRRCYRHDRDVGHLPAVLAVDAGAAGARSRTTACWRAARASALEAEMVRDVGAGRERPAQPRRSAGRASSRCSRDGIWDNPYNDDRWTTSTGEDRYRRGLYTFLRRTAPYPSS